MAQLDDLSKRIDELFNLVSNLERRLTKIETRLNLPPQPETTEPPPTQESEASAALISEETAENLEFQIGLYWLGRIGVFAIVVGLMFLHNLMTNNGHPFTAGLLGYGAAVVMLILSSILMKENAFFPRQLWGGALVLFLYSTLRLHYFTKMVLVQNEAAVLVAAYAILITGLYFSLKIEHNPLIFLAIILTIVTPLVTNRPFLIFVTLLGISLFASYLRIRWQKKGLFLIILFLTYFGHFLWFINNPFVTGKIGIARGNLLSLFFLTGYMLVFASGILLRPDRDQEDNYTIASSFLNSASAFVLFSLTLLLNKTPHLVPLETMFSVILLGMAIIFWIKEESRYSTFFFTIAGNMALTIALVAHFHLPDVFIWLNWQSLLVVILALWFRSKIIILANFFIFLFILIVFLIAAGKLSLVSISFGIVAVLSARIMNWQKMRLDLKTEFMRNAYLSVAFVVFPWTLYHSLPTGYVPLSWVALALIYYVLSLALKIKKYRWMAIGTFLLTAFYVIVLGIFKLSPQFRVLSFLGLGIVLLVISYLYAHMRNKKSRGE